VELDECTENKRCCSATAGLRLASAGSQPRVHTPLTMQLDHRRRHKMSPIGIRADMRRSPAALPHRKHSRLRRTAAGWLLLLWMAVLGAVLPRFCIGECFGYANDMLELLHWLLWLHWLH